MSERSLAGTMAAGAADNALHPEPARAGGAPDYEQETGMAEVLGQEARLAITYDHLAHPLHDGDLWYYDPAALHLVLGAAAHGAGLARVARESAAPPAAAAVRSFEAALRRRLLARSHAAWGKAWFWLLLGPALSLLWVNFRGLVAGLFFWLPPLAILIATLGAIVGGVLLAVVVGLLPAIWCWQRAATEMAQARRLGREARVLGGRRFRDSPLVTIADPALAWFEREAAPSVAEARATYSMLEEQGAAGAAQLARRCRTLCQLAMRAGLRAVAPALHTLYVLYDGLEQRLSRYESAESSMLAERRAASELRAARRRAAAVLEPYAPAGVSGSGRARLAPAAGLAAGGVVLALAVLASGAYAVGAHEAVIIDPAGARLARLLGLAGVGARAQGTATEITQTPGVHWTWPWPFAAHHAVSLEPQVVELHAIFRQTGEDRYDVLAVRLSYTIVDVSKWAQLDRNGDGADRLQGELSQLLENVLQRARQEARQMVLQQTPALANDPAQLAARADQLVLARMDDLVRAFVSTVATSDDARAAGVQISNQYASQLVQGVPGRYAGAGTITP